MQKQADHILNVIDKTKEEKRKKTSMFSIQFLILYLEVSSRDYCKNKFVLLHTVGIVERPLQRK